MAEDPYAKLEAALGDIAAIGNSLGEASMKVRVKGDDPKAMSLALYWRAWSNFRAFTMLWKEDLILEAEIIARSTIETAICLANLAARRQAFLDDLAADMSHTIGGQVKMMRRAQYDFSEEIATTWAAELATKGVRLDLEKLANEGDVKELYTYHRVLSAMSVHITGMSIGRHTPLAGEGDDAEKALEETKEADRRRAVVWMLPAMAATLMAHAGMIDDKVNMYRVAGFLEKLRPYIEAYSKGREATA